MSAVQGTGTRASIRKNSLYMILLVINAGAAASSYADRLKLSGEQIEQVFADVEDHAMVAGDTGASALNYWYSDGRFISRWKSTTQAGEVSGTWRVRNDERCVTIQSGMPDQAGREICSPIYRENDLYISVNPDGSIHGRHRLSPIHTGNN